MKEEKPRGTDPEACAYLYSASLEAPMGHDWTQIYLYIAGKVAARAKNAQSADDIKVDSLDDYQTGLLRDLKDWIYRHRVKVRQERRRAKKAQGHDRSTGLTSFCRYRERKRLRCIVTMP